MHIPLRGPRSVRGKLGARIAVPVATAVASLSVGAGAASAGNGGGGGVGAPQPPSLNDVTCAQKCAGVRKAIAGSRVVISGNHLGGVKRVRFTGADGSRLEVAPVKVGTRAVQANVPSGAATGKPSVTDGYGNAAVSPQALTIVKRIPVSAGFKLTSATAAPRNAYFDGTTRPTVSFMFQGTAATDVRVDVIARHTGGQVVASFVDSGAEPNTVNSAHWDGTLLDGRRAPGGVYRFSIGPAAGGDVATTSDSLFQWRGYKFPVRGPHSYGDGVGAPRAGHVHEGQDIPAACGTPLQAARGGRVQWVAYQSAAGNYIVIDGKNTGHDYVYMHLMAPSPLHKGQLVRTGQKIGVVGETGDATGCHLHMEEWSAPGWYQGGHYLSTITAHLKRWDRWS
jgi:murein DD-endopeptidase MepM/ murein hydrolase activator NlpD